MKEDSIDKKSNFINNLIYFYLFDFFIPFALCFLLVVIASRKSFYHKVLTLLPYFLGFFTIFIPYDCLLKYETTDMFLLFVKPTVFFAMIFSLWILIYLFSQSVKNRSSVGIKILLIFLMILISVVPAVLEILNFLKILFILKLALMILIYFAAILLFFIFVSKSKRKCTRNAGIILDDIIVISIASQPKRKAFSTVKIISNILLPMSNPISVSWRVP